MPTLTLTLGAGPAQRVASALGSYENLTDQNGDPRPATMQEAENHLRKYLKRLTVGEEFRAKEAALTYDPEPDIT